MTFGLPAFILAGGEGIRLRSVVSDVPKPLASVRGRPFLHHLLTEVARQGVRDVVLCVGYRAEQIVDACGDGSEFGLSIVYSRERELLGTAGALRQALELVPADTFFVFNGDSFMRTDLARLWNFHLETGAIVTMTIARVNDRTRFGSVIVDHAGRVTSFEPKQPGSGMVNAGIYVAERDAFADVTLGKRCSFEDELLPSLLNAGVYGVEVAEEFIDIGTPDSYAEAQSTLPGDETRS